MFQPRIFTRLFLLICTTLILLLHLIQCHLVDPEIRAHLEAKVISSMLLKDVESMVENDDRILNTPKSKFIIIPKTRRLHEGENYDNTEALIIERKPKKKYPKKATERSSYGFLNQEYDDVLRRVQNQPKLSFESDFMYDEKFPSYFGIADLETANSDNSRRFYESMVEKVVDEKKPIRDPLAFLEMAASQDFPAYRQRYSYDDAYAANPTEIKHKGKSYWKKSPERREEIVDENGCKTVVKKIMDPEDAKKQGANKAKSVIITKECEYPTVNGPDAKIPDLQPNLQIGSSRFDKPGSSSDYERDSSSYDIERPEELQLRETENKDSLAPDYIDRMLDTHFRSFPSFSNPISSFSGYQERFKLQAPSAIRNIKPTINVESYEYSNPKSGFDSNSGDYKTDDSVRQQNDDDYRPKTFTEQGPMAFKTSSPEYYQNRDYPSKLIKKEFPSDTEKERNDKKAPKMMKKSFAYYRKDDPKEDPNDQHYAEEYATGNYRSFSSSYDSEKDGPKKN